MGRQPEVSIWFVGRGEQQEQRLREDHSNMEALRVLVLVHGAQGTLVRAMSDVSYELVSRTAVVLILIVALVTAFS